MSVERYAVADVLVGTGQTLSVQFYAGSEPANPGAVTVTITDADGNAVVTDGATATPTPTTDPREYALTPADTVNLTTLTAVWTTDGNGDLADGTVVTTYADVVGDLLFTLAQARAFDGGAMADPAKYSDATLVMFRALIAEAFAERCGVWFGRRYRQVVLDGSGCNTLLLEDPESGSMTHVGAIRSVETREFGSQSWTTFEAGELADLLVDPWGQITRESGGVFQRGQRNIRVGVEYGFQRVPLEISRAALLVLRDVAVKSNIDDRATSYTDELGSRTFLVTAGIRGALYAIPEVNATLNQYVPERVPRFA